MINGLSTKTSCPVCKKQRNLQMDRVVSDRGGAFVVYNKCPHCQSAFLATISESRERGLLVVETLTDLSYREALAVLGKRPLVADALLEIYETLYKS